MRGVVRAALWLALFGPACGGNGGGTDADADSATDADADADTDADADAGADADADVDVDVDAEADADVPASCGNGRTEPGEACDGDDLLGFTCATVAAGFVGGTLGCRPDCAAFDVSGCAAGSTRAATSCSQQDVQAAIDAAADGDTILVPEGTCTWRTLVASRPPVALARKAIVLRGAGIDRTTILDETGTTGSETLLKVEGVAGKPFRVTGFTFHRTRTEDTDTYFIGIEGTALQWRVDHNRFLGAAFGSPDAAVHVSGRTHGVIDHCIFEGFARVTVFGDYFGENHGWKEPLSLGTADAVFVEDCTYDSRYEGTPVFSNAIDSNGNARWVFRYNVLFDRYVEAHGENWGPGGRGTFSYEVYGNEITDGESTWVPIALRGGTGVVHDNVFHGFTYGNRINIYNDRSCRDDRPEDGLCDDPDWTCDGTHPEDGNEIEASGTHAGADGAATLRAAGAAWDTDGWKHCTVRNTTDGSAGRIDANTADTVTASLAGGAENDWDAGDAFEITCGYPCLDQIGRSTDASETSIQPQAHEPLYEWNNTNDGSDTDIVPHDAFLLHPRHLQEGRDYVNDTPRPGYVPYPHPHPVAAVGD